MKMKMKLAQRLLLLELLLLLLLLLLPSPPAPAASMPGVGARSSSAVRARGRPVEASTRHSAAPSGEPVRCLGPGPMRVQYIILTSPAAPGEERPLALRPASSSAAGTSFPPDRAAAAALRLTGRFEYRA